MSKFSKILVALLASSFIAAPAFAITADFTGFLQTRGIAYDNMDGNDDLDDNARGVDSRFRLWTNTALNENVKAVFALEIDYTWGSTTNNLLGQGQVGSIGADAKGQIEIKQVYLDFNLPSVNTNLKVGTQYSVLGNGFILAGDDATGINARYTPTKGHSFLLTWIKTGEGDKFDDSVDADYYQLQYDGDFAGWRISPLFGYYDLQENDKALFYGASASGKLGSVALAATLIGNDWEVGTEDGSGIAALVNAKYSLNATTFSAEVGYVGDEDNTANATTSYATGGRGAFFAVRAYHQVSEIITGGRFDGRGTIGSNQTVTAGATAGPYEPNWQYVKLGAEHKCNDRTKVSAFYIYAEQAEDPSATIDAITYGHEIDAYLDYTIHKGLTFTLGGGYLLADDDFGDNQATVASEGGDDAWKVGTALTYTF